MRLGNRIFIGYIALLGVSSLLLLNSALDTLKPAMRQSAEETLVDTAHLLAVLVADEVRDGTVAGGDFARRMAAYRGLVMNARVWGVDKLRPNHRVYITDAAGRVIYDSSGRDVGADYSRWNDVHLTLRGRYGARSTPEEPGNDGSTVMYVAAPVRDGDRIIGVLTVAKPNVSMQPFIDRSSRRLLLAGAVVLLAAIGASVAVAWWIARPMRRLADYARSVSVGRRAALPRLREPGFAALAAALEQMRTRLDGKAYVERYVQTLTHELKSPLASIAGAAELLQETLPDADRARFVSNIQAEAARIRELVDRLLDLAQIEQRRELTDPGPVDLHALLDELGESAAARLRTRDLTLRNEIPADCLVHGDRFLLRQAFANLLDNAVDFTPRGGVIGFSAVRAAQSWEVRCHNSGAAIPEFALARIGERFFSLPRPDTGRKGSGLGLCFVREVAALHAGTFGIANDASGVAACLRLAAA
ncbi:MAG: two-component system sensor histidine kinase CreC [Gammaproteobacteria bacterium]